MHLLIGTSWNYAASLRVVVGEMDSEACVLHDVGLDRAGFRTRKIRLTMKERDGVTYSIVT